MSWSARAWNTVDCCNVFILQYLEKFDLAPVFSVEEFQHWFLPQTGIINSFVVENEGKITDMVSYYTLPSSIMHHQTHKTLRAAYSFYNVSTVTPWLELMMDALISARDVSLLRVFATRKLFKWRALNVSCLQLGFDVFNALDLMDNKEFLEPLKFGIGDGNLQYYLYNWRCPSMTPGKIGLVLQ